MAQKRKTNQSKLAEAREKLKKLEEKTAKSVKGRLTGNWRDNLFEIMMTRIDLAAADRKYFASLPAAFRQEPRQIPKFARIFFRTMRNMLKLAKAPASPAHIAAFSILYVSIIDVFLKDGAKDHAKTMAALDQRLGLFEKFVDFSNCRSATTAT